jgi:hypothetical protein
MAHTDVPAGTSAGPSAGSKRHLAHASHCTQSAATPSVAVTAAAVDAAAVVPNDIDADDIDDDVATSTVESTAADTPESSLATVCTVNAASFTAVSKSPSESDLALLPAAAVAAGAALPFWPFFLRRDAFP